MRILIADDHALFRDTLECFLVASGHEVVGFAEDGSAAVVATEDLRPDVLLLEMSITGLDALEATRRVTAEVPGTRVVLLVSTDGERFLVAALRAGAIGLVSRHVGGEQFLELLSGARRGNPVLSPALSRRLIEELRDPGNDGGFRRDRLTPREVDVLELMLQGVTSNTDLAQALRLSENTVRFHVRNILGKLQLHDRAQAVAYAARSGLFSISGAADA